MQIRSLLACALFAFSLSAPGFGAVLTFNFDNFNDGDAVVINGLTFTNATALSTSLIPAVPPRSNPAAAVDIGGPITILFDPLVLGGPISDVSGYFTYTQQLTVQAFNASNVLVDTAVSLFSANFAGSGNQPNELLSLSGSDIRRVVFTAAPSGTSFTLDDLSLTTVDSQVVPEPATVALVGAALGLVCVARRRRA